MIRRGAMDRRTRRQLMRWLTGEASAPESERLRRRFAGEPELAATGRRLARRWRRLELPEPQPAPPGFAARVVARARRQRDPGLAPDWWGTTLAGRTATAALLAAGIALGALLVAPRGSEDWSEYLIAEPTMAESYWTVVDEPASTPGQESRP